MRPHHLIVTGTWLLHLLSWGWAALAPWQRAYRLSLPYRPAFAAANVRHLQRVVTKAESDDDVRDQADDASFSAWSYPF